MSYQTWFFDGLARCFDVLAMVLFIALLIVTATVVVRVVRKYRQKRVVGAWR